MLSFVSHLRAGAGVQLNKIVLHIVLCCCLFAFFVVPAFAVPLPEAELEDGNTVLGTFITSSLIAEDKEYLRNWFASDRNLLLRLSDGSYLFLVIPSNVTVSVFASSYSLASITFRGGGLWGVSFDSWSASSPNFITGSRVAYSATTGPSNCILVSGSIFESASITLPMPTDSYVASYTGNLLLRDDGGLLGSGGESEGGWWQGILDWLSSFWDELKKFFIGLFVPESGYFEKWVNELRSALLAKLGGLTAFFDTLNSFFTDMQASSNAVGEFSIKVPPNSFYKGYSGITVDVMSTILRFTPFLKPVFSGLIFLFSLIACYRHIIVLFEK